MMVVLWQLLATEILDRVIHSRKQLREAALQEEQTKSTQDSDVSLKRAQDTARNILNISQSDLDDIMSADGDHEAQVNLLFYKLPLCSSAIVYSLNH